MLTLRILWWLIVRWLWDAHRIQQKGIDSGAQEGFRRGALLQSLIRDTFKSGSRSTVLGYMAPSSSYLWVGYVGVAAGSPIRTVSTNFYHGVPCYHVWRCTIVLPWNSWVYWGTQVVVYLSPGIPKCSSLAFYPLWDCTLLESLIKILCSGGSARVSFKERLLPLSMMIHPRSILGTHIAKEENSLWPSSHANSVE